MDFTDAHVRTLVAKIEGLQLSSQEQAALSALLDAAEGATDDVAGYRHDHPAVGMRMFNVLGVAGNAGGTPDGIADGPPDTSLEIHTTATYVVSD